MNTIKVFEQLNIRFVEHPEVKYEFGIVSSDLACVLGLGHDGHKIARSVDDEWKGLHNMHTPGGNQSMTVIWEPGVYQLLAKSRKPLAKPFQKWIFEEVLPSIRKTGGYSLNQTPPQTYLEALKALVAAEEEKELLRLQNAQLEEETERLSEAVDELFNYSSIIRIAKYNNCSEKNFNWRILKAASDAMNCEIKKVPCPRYVTKNLYSHDVWRRAYPGVSLPETTTLTIVN